MAEWHKDPTLLTLLAVVLVAASFVLAISFKGERNGCFKLANCEGVVTLDGNPVRNAIIRLSNQDCSGYSRTDAHGEFRIEVGEGKVAYNGIPPGTYRVAIFPNTPEQIFLHPSTEIDEPIPAIYHDFKTSPLMIDVPYEGIANWSLELNSP